MTTVRLLIIFPFLLLNILHAEELRDPGEYFFSQTFFDMTEELSIAKEEDKKAILIMFQMDECPFCHWMKKHVLNRKNVQEYFRENFHIFSIDVEGDNELIDFNGKETIEKEFSLKQYRVRATPVFLFVDLEGKPIKRAKFIGKSSDVEEFMLLGRYVADEKYKDIKFNLYKREIRKAKRPTDQDA